MAWFFGGIENIQQWITDDGQNFHLDAQGQAGSSLQISVLEGADQVMEGIGEHSSVSNAAVHWLAVRWDDTPKGTGPKTQLVSSFNGNGANLFSMSALFSSLGE